MFFCSLSALCCSDWVSFIDLAFCSPVLSSFFSILLLDILLFKKISVVVFFNSVISIWFFFYDLYVFADIPLLFHLFQDIL